MKSSMPKLMPSVVFKIEALIWVSFWRTPKFPALQLKDRFKSKTSIEEYRNANTKPILNLCIYYIVHVSSTLWKIKNQPSNSTSCSESTLRLAGSCGGQIMLRTSSDVLIFNLGLRFERLFWERYILKGQIVFEGHWRLQSWTLAKPLQETPTSKLQSPCVKTRKFHLSTHLVKFGTLSQTTCLL